MACGLVTQAKCVSAIVRVCVLYMLGAWFAVYDSVCLPVLVLGSKSNSAWCGVRVCVCVVAVMCCQSIA